jgi:hypothetical protein
MVGKMICLAIVLSEIFNGLNSRLNRNIPFDSVLLDTLICFLLLDTLTIILAFLLLDTLICFLLDSVGFFEHFF